MIKSISTIAGMCAVGMVASTVILISLTMLGALLRFVLWLWQPLTSLLGL